MAGMTVIRHRAFLENKLTPEQVAEWHQTVLKRAGKLATDTKVPLTFGLLENVEKLADYQDLPFHIIDEPSRSVSIAQTYTALVMHENGR